MAIRSLAAFVIIAYACIHCSTHDKDQISPKEELVDLKGRPAFVVIKNLAEDTLKLEAYYWTFLPNYEEKIPLNLPPGSSDSINLIVQYPNFLHLGIGPSNTLKLFVSPCASITCNIKEIAGDRVAVSYEGPLQDINDYYAAHHNNFGSAYEQNRPYFIAGDVVKDFSDYPHIVDSIGQLSISFLINYDHPLPEWFVRWEAQRVKYLTGWIKYNCPITKEFYEQRTIPRGDKYYDFEKDFDINDPDLILSHHYISYVYHFIFEHKKNRKPDDFPVQFHIIDSLFGPSEKGDIARGHFLSMLFEIVSPEEYEHARKAVSFGKYENGPIFDSLIMARVALPRIGVKCPDIPLIDLNGETRLLSDFKGDVLMINFWAPWCGPCIQEFPYENELSERYKNHGLTMINICVESSMQKWKLLSHEKDLKMVNLFCKPDEYVLLKRRFNLSGLPRTILVSRDFKVIQNHGKRASDITDAEIMALLNKGH